MRAVCFEAYGPPEVLRLLEVETPIPGPGQVRIRVAAAAVNPADHKWREGMFQDWYPLSFPHVLGYDVAGIVDAVGPGVAAPGLGDRVVALLNAATKGGYAEFALADANLAIPIPEAMDFGIAAALPTAALTGVQLIEDHIHPEPGQTVLLTGAVGAVGRFTLHAAPSLDVRVIAAVRASQVDEARALGADDVIVLGEAPPADLAFDHVADTVGGGAVAALCRALGPRSRIRTVATTPIDPEALRTEPVFVAIRPDGSRLARLIEAVAAGEVPVPVSRRMPLAEAAAAHVLMEAGGLGGKIILEP